MEPPPRLPAWAKYLLVTVLTLAVCTPLLKTAFFCLDDYRYLQGLRDHAAGDSQAWARSIVVENRWDTHWWMPDDTYVRFFRPYMISSYMADEVVWGGPSAVGFTFTNVVMHLATTLLVMACFVRLLGAGIGSLLGAISFGLQPAHFENLYYIPGRAMTMATIGIAAAILAHLCTRERTTPLKQILVASICGAAFFGKEAAALLPVFVLLLDWLVPPGGTPRSLLGVMRRNATFLLVAAILAGIYLWVRTMALGEAGPGTNVYPYIHWPQRDGFLQRTGAVWVMYCAGMSSGSLIHTFAELPRQIYARLDAWEIVLGAAWVHGLLLFGLTDRRGRWLVLLFALSIVPLLPLYSSGRHLYTATIGYCGLVGLAIQRAWVAPHALGRIIAPAIVVVFVGLPGLRLTVDLLEHPPLLSKSDPVAVYASMVHTTDMELDPALPAYLLDFPGGWYEMQFAQAALEVALDRDLPTLHFLTTTRVAGKSPAQTRRIDDHTLEIDRGEIPILPFGGGGGGFDLRSLEPGTVVQRPGFTVEILECTDRGRPKRIRVRFEQPLAEIQLGQCIRPADRGWTLRRLRL